jgi:hypothetical protein
MKKNLVLGAAITAALLAGNVQALTVTDIDANKFPVFDASNTRVVYMSGASAAATFVEKVFTGAGVAADQICDVTLPIWKFKDNIDGSTQKAYLCTQSAQAVATGLVLNADKPNLLLMKRDEGGSGYGVSPIISEANGDSVNAAIEFMKVTTANCGASAGLTAIPTPVAANNVPAGVLTNVVCAYTSGAGGNNNLVVPDVGVSDVDPLAFKGANAPLKTDNTTYFSNVTSADVAKLTVTPGAAVVFGLPVTLKLYRALQGAQLAMGTIPTTGRNNTNSADVTCAVGDVINQVCMPSLSKQEVASLMRGDWSNWNKLMVTIPGVASPVGLAAWATANQSADAPGSTATHICRRENGSGTQAQLNNFAFAYPCSKASELTPAVGNDGLNGNTGTRTEGQGVALIHENSTSGRVTACLSNLNTGIDTAGDGFEYTTAGVQKYVGVRWAIGIQALEKKDANFEFVKINGVAPTLANVANGSYLDWFENTFQYNTTHAKFAVDTGLRTTIDAIIKAATVPAVMGSINAGSGLSHGFGNGAYLANPKANTPPITGIFSLAAPVNPYSHTPDAATTLDNCRAPVTYNKSVAGL